MYGFILSFYSNFVRKIFDIKMSWPWKLGYGSVKVIENVTVLARVHMTCYSRSTPTMGLSRTVSEIDGDFGWKLHNFPTPLHFASPLKGFPLELGTSAGGQKTRMIGLPGHERSLKISSAVWIQCTNVTDRRTDTGPQQWPRLRIASRGKKSDNVRTLHS